MFVMALGLAFILVKIGMLTVLTSVLSLGIRAALLVIAGLVAVLIWRQVAK
jgi:hypothetical protein